MTEKKSYRTVEKFLRGALIVIAAFFLCCNVYVLVARHVFKNDMPTLFGSVRFLTTAIVSEMSYAAYGSLQRNALFSIGLVLFLFIMLINALLRFVTGRDK